jgi:hypothetical protein
MTAIKQASPQRPSVQADRRRHARRVAYLGCAAALGYGVLKLVWSLDGTVGRNGRMPPPPASIPGLGRLFDYWGTPILAGLAVVILLGVVFPWGSVPIVRPLLRVLAWAESLLAVAGVGEFVQTIRYLVGNLREHWLGGIYPATFLFVGACFLVLGLAFRVTAWLTRR